ncbi:acetate--CoA ligase family protein [Microbacterium sp. NPDC055357]
MSLTTLLDPQSIAVIGASGKPDSVGGRILAQVSSSFSGPIYPINPKYDEIGGRQAYATIGDIGQPVELVLAAAPSRFVVEALRDGAAAGATAAVVFSSGFAEIGGDGPALQADLRALADQTGMRIMGPNCLGFASFRGGPTATFTRISFEPKPGNIGVVAQSGSTGIGAASLLRDDGAGIGFWAATGNELDVTVGDISAELLGNPDFGIDVIATIIETAVNAESLLRAGRDAAESGQRIVALKVGSTDRGRAAALSHTAAITGDYATFAAACEQNGIVLVKTIRELVDTARGFATRRLPKGRRVAVISSSGGQGAIMADATERAGLELPPPSLAIQQRLREALPSFGSAANPIDITGNLVNDLSAVERVLTEVDQSGEFDAIAYSTVARTLPDELRDMVGRAASASTPFFAVAHQPDMVAHMADRGVTCFADGTALINVLGRMAAASSATPYFNVELPETGISALPEVKPGALPESASKHVVSHHGIRVPREWIAQSIAEAIAAVDAAGTAVMKIDAPWLPHKSDVGGVILGVQGRDAAETAYARLVEIIERLRPDPAASSRILVAEQIPPGLELMIGMTRDEIFGPVITVAAGGIGTEIMAQSQVSVSPFNRARAEAMVDRLWDGRLVTHRRGMSPAARDGLIDALMALQRLAISEPSVTEVDVNPLLATADGVVAVDALVVVGYGTDAEPVEGAAA